MSTQLSNESTAGFQAAEAGCKTLWQRAQHGWPARYPIVQFPNAPLLIAMAGLLVAALATGYVHDYARATFFAAVAVWA